MHAPGNAMAQEGKDGKTRLRRGGGFRRAGDRTRPLLEEVAGRHGFAQADVLLRWAEIVGEALAPTCRPVRVSYRGGRGRDHGLGATLVVQTNSARAPEVEHLAPRIIERVNQFYGYRAIARVRITQTGPAPGFAETHAAFAAPAANPNSADPNAAAPTDADTARAAALTAGVEDAGLRSALTRLGANVLARRRARPVD
jgi:hypothetical protein